MCTTTPVALITAARGASSLRASSAAPRRGRRPASSTSSGSAARATGRRFPAASAARALRRWLPAPLPLQWPRHLHRHQLRMGEEELDRRQVPAAVGHRRSASGTASARRYQRSARRAGNEHQTLNPPGRAGTDRRSRAWAGSAAEVGVLHLRIAGGGSPGCRTGRCSLSPSRSRDRRCRGPCAHSARPRGSSCLAG